MKNIRGKDILSGLTGVLMLLGGISFLLVVIEKIRSGQALEYYRTGMGIETNYLVSLITFGLFALLIVGLMVYTWMQKRPSNKPLQKKKR